MTFAAASVMKRASTVLQDDGAVRWTAPEMRDYLNDGLRELVALKPNAKTATVEIPLDLGAKQALPAAYTMLCDVIGNRIAGNAKAIRMLASRKIIDAQIPGWQDSAVLPFSDAVTHVFHDLRDPRTFYVVPGNTGDGIIDAVVGTIPSPVPAPASDVLDVDSYTSDVDVPDIYQNALIDYVLYRAFSKDSAAPGAAARASAHLELFRAAVTGFAAAESAMSLASSAARPGA